MKEESRRTIGGTIGGTYGTSEVIPIGSNERTEEEEGTGHVPDFGWKKCAEKGRKEKSWE